MGQLLYINLQLHPTFYLTATNDQFTTLFVVIYAGVRMSLSNMLINFMNTRYFG